MDQLHLPGDESNGSAQEVVRKAENFFSPCSFRLLQKSYYTFVWFVAKRLLEVAD